MAKACPSAAATARAAPCGTLPSRPPPGRPFLAWPPRRQAHHQWHPASSASPVTQPGGGGLVAAGPVSPPPDYSDIDAQPLNRLVYGLFRKRMVQAIGSDSKLEGYAAIIDLTRRLNSMHAVPRGTQEATRGILRSLFPAWLPPAFSLMFSKPMPGLSCKLNAWATWLTCQWLMGECEVNDVEIDGGVMGHGHGVLVKRCRYLEEAGCASICINSCKVPTQEFFARDMSLALTMTPNYEDFSCQFSFGKTPPPEAEDPAFATSCFKQCPTAQQVAGNVVAEAPRCHKIELNQ